MNLLDSQPGALSQAKAEELRVAAEKTRLLLLRAQDALTRCRSKANAPGFQDEAALQDKPAACGDKVVKVFTLSVALENLAAVDKLLSAVMRAAVAAWKAGALGQATVL